MVVIPLFNGMLSDGLMVRSIDVMSRMMSGGEKVTTAVFTADHNGASPEFAIKFPITKQSRTLTPAFTICISFTSIPPVPSVVPLKVNT